MSKKNYNAHLRKGGGPNIEPDENPTDAKIAYDLADELICPLSYALMIDPVVLSSGKTYERAFIHDEFARQRLLNPGARPYCPFIKTTQDTDMLIPNMQMRSITAKFVELYKDVGYAGFSWKEIRRLCRVYQDEQVPERFQERKRANEEIEKAKRVVERKQKQEKEQKERFIEERMQELDRLKAREKELLAREARLARDAEIARDHGESAREASERLAREARVRLEREYFLRLFMNRDNK